MDAAMQKLGQRHIHGLSTWVAVLEMKEYFGDQEKESRDCGCVTPAMARLAAAAGPTAASRGQEWWWWWWEQTDAYY